MSTPTTHLQKLQDWMELRNYSAATISAYRCALRQFLGWREAEGFSGPFGQEEARRYLLSRYRSGKKWQTVNGDYSAMRKFYEHALGQEWDVEHLPRPRKERSLPGILSTEEVGRLISHGRTFKHQVYSERRGLGVMHKPDARVYADTKSWLVPNYFVVGIFMVLLYSTGLRLSEALNLRIVDIDGQRRQLRIVKGKGAKGRYVSFPECLLEVLRNYYRAYRPEGYLFNGKYRGSRWAGRSAQHSLEQARQAAGVERSVSPHTLRHCYATHHLENGTNLVYLKEQLGHKHLKTTARYIHLCQSYDKRVAHPIAGMEVAYRQEAR